jgi:hypothetical protein
MVDLGSWSRRMARDIIPIDGISRLIYEHIGVQQTAADWRRTVKPWER